MIHENISIIVAIAQNFAIGKNNDLLFHLPNDLKHFKEITSGHTIIMENFHDEKNGFDYSYINLKRKLTQV
jgi:dihydrofolate reductase